MRLHFRAGANTDLDLFLDPMGHLNAGIEDAAPPPETGVTTMRVYLISSELLTGTAVLQELSSMGNVTSSDGVIWFDPWTDSLRIVDRGAQCAYLIYRDADPESWRRPEHSREFIELIFRDVHGTAIHGATIGDVDRGILIAARGGSGKSTLVARCLPHGLRTTGDDYLIYQGGPEGSVGAMLSVYRTIKLPHEVDPGILAGADIGLHTEDGTKRLLHPDRALPECFSRSQTPVAIVIPSFACRFAVEPADPHIALRALLPSSVVMSVDPGRVIRSARDLVRELPAFRISLGMDFDRDLPELLDFLSSLGIVMPIEATDA